MFDGKIENVFFLNARRGTKGVELLCYTSGEHRREVSSEGRSVLMEKLLGRSLAEGEFREIERKSYVDDPSALPAAAKVSEN